MHPARMGASPRHARTPPPQYCFCAWWKLERLKPTSLVDLFTVSFLDGLTSFSCVHSFKKFSAVLGTAWAKSYEA
jgi:hypothetical protein